MSIDPTKLTDFFTRDYSDEVISKAFNVQDNYQSGYIDILLQRARSNKSVRENKIFDYIEVENDPNFSRNADHIKNKFEKYISALSMSTSIVTVINSQLQLSGLSNMIPKNLQALLFNFQTIADTNINMLSNIQRLVSFKQIEQALFSDLKFNFLGEVITFQEIALFADRILTTMPTQDSIKNAGLRPLLSLGIQNLLPKSVLGIFETAQWLDTLNDIFFEDEASRAVFNNELKAGVNNQAKVKVDTVVVKDRYDDITLGLDDPLGLTVKQEFTTELQTNYINALDSVIETIAVDFDLDFEDMQAVKDIIIEDTYANISEALENNSLALPKLSAVTKAVNTESYNQTVNAVITATNILMSEIINDIGIKQTPTGQRPLDYLQNLKKNIKRRTELQQRGTTSQELERIDSYLRSVTQNGKINTKLLNELNARVNAVLKED